MKLHESHITSNIWYFGNNRSPNLRLSKPHWYAPFFLTVNYAYAADYADYGVYMIDLSTETRSNILDFSNIREVSKLKWPKIVVDLIQAGANDLNSIAYDLYALAFNANAKLHYVFNSKDWQVAAAYFKKKSQTVMKNIKPLTVWGSEPDHKFVLQMWKDIYDAGFSGFTQIEFGKPILAIFEFKCIDKISIRPIQR